MSEETRTKIVIPQIGESINTAEVGRWLKSVGDAVAEGDPLLEVDSDKASLEIPSPVSGRLVEIVSEEGEEVPIGAVVGWLVAGSAEQAASSPAGDAGASPSSTKGPPTGPAARQAAVAAGVDIRAVTGTGARGRVLRRDVEEARAASQPAVSREVPAAQPAPKHQSHRRVERIPMTPLRRTIARRLVEAQHTAAMLTTFNEIDMSRVMSLRKTYQEKFVKRYGIKVGFMSFFVKATVEALKAFPAVNSEIDESNPRRPAVLYKSYYNIGVAVSTPRGLMVPVVTGADQLSFAETEQRIGELARKGRDNQLKPSDFSDGTFTISNGGVFGSLMSTPILNPPQVGILGMHTIKKRPVEVNGEIALRPMMYVALSYDHRIIDGREAVGFLCRIKDLVEAPERILLEV